MGIGGVPIFLLPVAAGADSIWLAMPITELLVSAYMVVKMSQYTKRLPN